MRFKMVYYNIKTQNLGCYDLKGVSYALPISLSLRTNVYNNGLFLQMMYM